MSTTSQIQVTTIRSLAVTRRARKHQALLGAAASVVILALGLPVCAQTFRGTILGTVTDPNGAVVP